MKRKKRKKTPPTVCESAVLLPLLAANLRRERARADLSQFQLATRANLAPSYISMLEGRRRSATLETIERLAQAMGLDPLKLLNRRGEKS